MNKKMDHKDLGSNPYARASVSADLASARVLIYGMNFAPEPTGVGRYTGELFAYLVEQKIEVEAVTAVPHYPGWALRSGYRNRYSFETTDTMRVFRCPLLLHSETHGIWRLLTPLSFAVTSGPIVLWRIVSTRPDTILCVEPTLLAAPLAMLAAKIFGVRTVLHVQDLEVDAAFAMKHLESGWLKSVAKFVERVILKRFDAIVTISERMKEKLIEKGVARQKLSLVRNWVHLANQLEPKCTSVIRRELNIDSDTFVAMYAGNVGAKQALPILLDAAARIESEPIVFLIVGEGPEKQRLMARYGSLANVRFLPVQPERKFVELLNMADVHILPQDRDAADLVLPSKLGGMLASGRPCIVMADPGTELYEFLGDGAVITPPGDCGRLTDAILSVAHGRGDIKLGDNNERLWQLSAELSLPALQEVLVPAKVKGELSGLGRSV